MHNNSAHKQDQTRRGALTNGGEFGVLGSEYELFACAVPHHDEFQRRIGVYLRDILRNEGTVDSPLLIEIGTGTGLTTRNVLSALPDARVLSIEIDSAMLDAARPKLRDSGKRLQLINRDASDYLAELPSNSVDGIFSGFTIHNMPRDKRKALLGEAARVLRSGAPLVDGDKIAKDDDAAQSKDLADQIARFAIFDTVGRPELREYWTAHYRTDERNKMTEAEIITALAESGLRTPHVVWRAGMEAIVVATKDKAAGPTMS
jgi:ubiquinone/menaquinone biosynthesis C-methylase UbiE